jgi:hypothetical protein
MSEGAAMRKPRPLVRFLIGVDVLLIVGLVVMALLPRDPYLIAFERAKKGVMVGELKKMLGEPNSIQPGSAFSTLKEIQELAFWTWSGSRYWLKAAVNGDGMAVDADFGETNPSAPFSLSVLLDRFCQWLGL